MLANPDGNGNKKMVVEVLEITIFLLYWTAGTRFTINTTDSFLKKFGIGLK
ncbi:hypothetical protein [Flavobacterium cheonanense]|uniref:hypothetical protein n=1 Tax=Flavobacterium cheonanense TaxID=706183 RepID=UPI0031CEA2F3